MSLKSSKRVLSQWLMISERPANQMLTTFSLRETYGDNRVSRLPLLNSGPWHVLSLTAFYLYFVKIYGPQLMKNRQPMNLKWIMFIHNIALVVVNGGGFLTALFGRCPYLARASTDHHHLPSTTTNFSLSVSPHRHSVLHAHVQVRKV